MRPLNDRPDRVSLLRGPATRLAAAPRSPVRPCARQVRFAPGAWMRKSRYRAPSASGVSAPITRTSPGAGASVVVNGRFPPPPRPQAAIRKPRSSSPQRIDFVPRVAFLSGRVQLPVRLFLRAQGIEHRALQPPEPRRSLWSHPFLLNGSLSKASPPGRMPTDLKNGSGIPGSDTLVLCIGPGEICIRNCHRDRGLCDFRRSGRTSTRSPLRLRFRHRHPISGRPHGPFRARAGSP